MQPTETITKEIDMQITEILAKMPAGDRYDTRQDFLARHAQDSEAAWNWLVNLVKTP